MNRPKVVVATPFYGGMASFSYMSSILNCVSSQRNFDFGIASVSNESLITRARNALVAEFLNSDGTHLLFIDADIRFKPEHISRLLSSGKEVIGGICPIKSVDFEAAFSSNATDHGQLRRASEKYAVDFLFDDSGNVIMEGSLAEVRHIGTAFLLISRKALIDVIEANPDLAYDVDGREQYALFDTAIVDREYLSEDYAFCHRYRKIGGKVWAETSCVVSHFGNYEFGATVDPICGQE